MLDFSHNLAKPSTATRRGLTMHFILKDHFTLLIT